MQPVKTAGYRTEYLPLRAWKAAAGGILRARAPPTVSHPGPLRRGFTRGGLDLPKGWMGAEAVLMDKLPPSNRLYRIDRIDAQAPYFSRTVVFSKHILYNDAVEGWNISLGKGL